VQHFKSVGWRVPEDISVVGFDDGRLAAMASPALSTVHVSTYQIGFGAIEQLMLLLSSQAIVRDLILEAELVVRRSAGPPRRHRPSPST
jgi:LacI family repressor for deo operon, udp, cdd, tsx, nupC, and nupG